MTQGNRTTLRVPPAQALVTRFASSTPQLTSEERELLQTVTEPERALLEELFFFADARLLPGRGVDAERVGVRAPRPGSSLRLFDNEEAA